METTCFKGVQMHGETVLSALAKVLSVSGYDDSKASPEKLSLGAIKHFPGSDRIVTAVGLQLHSECFEGLLQWPCVRSSAISAFIDGDLKLCLFLSSEHGISEANSPAVHLANLIVVQHLESCSLWFCKTVSTKNSTRYSMMKAYRENVAWNSTQSMCMLSLAGLHGILAGILHKFGLALFCQNLYHSLKQN